MTPFTRLTAIALPLLRDDVNTDAIIPSREIKSVSKQGLADGLFADWRYTEVGGREPNPGFVLNEPRFACARILLSGSNFGCGSSREHAAWALFEYGFRAIVAEGFNPIFYSNAILNGIVPVTLPRAAITTIAAHTGLASDPRVTVDLDAMRVTSPDGSSFHFTVDGDGRAMLLGGFDTIDLTCQHDAAIATFRLRDAQDRPWAYPG